MLIEIDLNDRLIFQKIEKRREFIIKEDIPLKIIDYGAGTPSSTRSESEMYKGRIVHTSTSKMGTIGLKNEWAEYIYKIVKTYKPKVVLELGTCCGFSSAYMSQASAESKIYTIEGAEELANIAKENRKSLGCTNVIQIIGRFQDVLDSTLEDIKMIDFAFIDGHHDELATIEYFKKIKPYLSRNSIIVFDDISWSNGMKKAWSSIIQDNDIKKFEDIDKLGVCYF